MTQEHPITPPPELVQEWARYQGFESPEVLWRQIATEAARWGADQELEACYQEVQKLYGVGSWLRSLRRPKPPSLKEQALGLLNEGPVSDLLDDEVVVIRRALESLPD